MVAVADRGIVPEEEERFTTNLDKRIPGASWAEISMASSRAGASEEGCARRRVWVEPCGGAWH